MGIGVKEIIKRIKTIIPTAISTYPMGEVSSRAGG